MLKLAKPLLFALALVPAALLVWAGANGTLGVNPAETLQLETGVWALRFLLLTLAVTPVRRLTGWNRVIQYRRMLGLFAFFYASVHFLTYLVLDRFFDFSGMVADVIKRPFIAAGMVALLLMFPLAVTSTKGWIRRLGKRWQVLHRLIYVSAVAAAVHYLWKVKLVAGPPVYYAAGVALLLAFRIWWQLKSANSLKRQHVSA
ncbi:MAG TPA: protein-methionine-sulfoxide reductase heme-binding subunit MsrQ [Vicinamibacterales bacterium]